jgi:hypothetical protein
MTAPAAQGNIPSFFVQQQTDPDDTDLLSAQVDPSQPEVEGLTSVTDPVIPDRVILDRLTHLDPTLYDLRDSSHLMRLIKALVGASGVGGLRKQMTVARLAASPSGAHFFDLDGFWGALFGMPRLSNEALPVNDDGTNFDPASQAADQDTWDAISGSDGRYRARLYQFARAVNQGATFQGIQAAAEAILSCDVDLMESWILADRIPPGTVATTINADTFLMVESKYGTYGGMKGNAWGLLSGGIHSDGQTPLGNRSEVVLRPARAISQEEKLQVMRVLDTIRPAGLLVTVLEGGTASLAPVSARSYYSDSDHWSISSSVTPRPDLITPVEDLYPSQGEHSAARPALQRVLRRGLVLQQPRAERHVLHHEGQRAADVECPRLSDGDLHGRPGARLHPGPGRDDRVPDQSRPSRQ